MVNEKIIWLADFVVHGEPASKANSRRLVKIRNRTMFIKSKKALSYVEGFKLQCPQLDPLITDDLIIAVEIFYASKRPDLDESVILDAMQGRIYANDRQIKQKHIFWNLDRENPRAHIRLAKL